ncbi:hypothetical protein L484_006368 [Morus notabilis]|uniref:Uncharacterized protein n=1 Tax=Morus notabilis TaxID=981085 RepID=W9SGZ7_9ROSA|nr:hypothetical protein L484_006368 [Morus notabilis]
MKISVAVFFAFVIMFASLHAKAKSDLAATKPDQVVDQLRNDPNSNLGRKVNVGALSGIGKNKPLKYDINIEEEDNDANEAFGKSGSDPTADSHRIFTKGNNPPKSAGQQHN